jgi:hypothetical protein
VRLPGYSALGVVAGISGGTDFAVGGSVTGPSGENNTPVAGLDDLSAQLASFEAAFPTPVAGALYTVWSGSNDVLNLLNDANFASLNASGAAATDVATSAANEVQMVANLAAYGAGTVLVLNVPDLGEIPAITQAGSAAADATAQQFSALFNQDLTSDLAATNFGGTHVVVEDIYSLINGAIADPAAYGLTNVSSPVYTGGLGSETGTIVSTDPAVQDQYLFFDHEHPTETGHAFIAQEAEAVLGIACFAEGTRISTPRGSAKVESLRAGDVVRVRGGTAPVRWVGQRRLALAGVPDRGAAQPVRIRAGAFGKRLPSRDLLLSPEHAVFVDGVLIPVRALTGCAGIDVDPDIETVTYFHVELDRHAVLLAEGLPCESWLDTGNRAMFDNAAHARPLPLPACAPIVESGPILDAIRQRFGGAATQEVRLDRPGVHDVAILPGTGALRLASRIGRAPGDARRLGVAIATVALDDAPIPLTDTRLASGFHAAEEGWRWTDGAGLLTVAGASSLRVDVVALAP